MIKYRPVRTNKNHRKGANDGRFQNEYQAHQQLIKRLKFAKMKQAIEARKEKQSCR